MNGNMMDTIEFIPFESYLSSQICSSIRLPCAVPPYTCRFVLALSSALTAGPFRIDRYDKAKIKAAGRGISAHRTKVTATFCMLVYDPNGINSIRLLCELKAQQRILTKFSLFVTRTHLKYKNKY